ncbi:60S ribosomal protein L26-1 [Bienertia sinuspersici]
MPQSPLHSTIKRAQSDHESATFRRPPKKYNMRSMLVRKDDEVQVMRGTYKGREGKVIGVTYQRGIMLTMLFGKAELLDSTTLGEIVVIKSEDLPTTPIKGFIHMKRHAVLSIKNAVSL